MEHTVIPSLLGLVCITVIRNGNLFDILMAVTKACSLGQISDHRFNGRPHPVRLPESVLSVSASGSRSE